MTPVGSLTTAFSDHVELCRQVFVDGEIGVEVLPVLVGASLYLASK